MTIPNALDIRQRAAKFADAIRRGETPPTGLSGDELLLLLQLEPQRAASYVTAMFEALLAVTPEEDQSYMAGNDVVGKVWALGDAFEPDIAGLFEIYLKMYGKAAPLRRKWLQTKDDYLIFTTHPYLAFSWQLAWTMARADEDRIRRTLGSIIDAASGDVRVVRCAAADLLEDVAIYRKDASAPQFGGGSGPGGSGGTDIQDFPASTSSYPAARPDAYADTGWPAPTAAAPQSSSDDEDGTQRPKVPLQAAHAGPGATLDLAEGREFTVWYGTNRRPVDPGNQARGFSHARDDTVHMGKCVALLPDCRAFGSTGSPAWKRWLKGQDDRVRLSAIVPLGADVFWNDVRNALREREAWFKRRDVLVFIHGFHTRFEEAAVRAAQLGADLGVRGITAFFSWPSRGRLLGYLADEAAIEDSEAHIEEFLVRLAHDTDAERVHIIAHSMGNRGLLRAMQRITAGATAKGAVRFGQVFLAAPDVDVGTFRKLAQAYASLSDRTTLYISRRDRAVWLSLLLHMFPRVGYAPPVTVLEGLDTIEVSAIDFSLIGHGAYAQAEALLYDMGGLIASDVPPNLRVRMRSAKTSDGQSYWSLIS